MESHGERLKRALSRKDWKDILVTVGSVGVFGTFMWVLSRGKIPFGKKVADEVAATTEKAVGHSGASLPPAKIKAKGVVGADFHTAACDGALAKSLKTSPLKPDELHTRLLQSGLRNQTPLHIAARQGHLPEVLAALESKGLSTEQIQGLLDAKMVGGINVFDKAAAAGHIDKPLLDALKTCGMTDDHIKGLFAPGSTLLHTAGGNGHLGKTIKTLQENGFAEDKIQELLKAEMPVKGSKARFTPVGVAVANGHLNTELATTLGLDANAVEALLKGKVTNGQELIGHVAEKGHLPKLQVTLTDLKMEQAKIKDLMIGAASGSVPPYHTAIVNGHLNKDLMKTLSGLGVDTKALLKKDELMHELAANGHLSSTVKELDAHFSRDEMKAILCTIRNGQAGLTPLAEAAIHGKLDANLLDQLKRYGIDNHLILKQLSSPVGSDGRILLHDAADQGHLAELVNTLKCPEQDIQKVLNTESKNLTLLQYTAAKGHWDPRLQPFAKGMTLDPGLLKTLADNGFTPQETQKFLLTEFEKNERGIDKITKNDKLVDWLKAMNRSDLDKKLSVEDIQALLSTKGHNGITPAAIMAEKGQLSHLLTELNAHGLDTPKHINPILTTGGIGGVSPFSIGAMNALKDETTLPTLLGKLKTQGFEKAELEPLLLRQANGKTVFDVAAEKGYLPALLKDLPNHGFVEQDIQRMLSQKGADGRKPLERLSKKNVQAVSDVLKSSPSSAYNLDASEIDALRESDVKKSLFGSVRKKLRKEQTS